MLTRLEKVMHRRPRLSMGISLLLIAVFLPVYVSRQIEIWQVVLKIKVLSNTDVFLMQLLLITYLTIILAFSALKNKDSSRDSSQTRENSTKKVQSYATQSETQDSGDQLIAYEECDQSCDNSYKPFPHDTESITGKR